MKNTIIQGIQIDWSKIEQDSYLQEIPSLKNIDSLEFSNNVTFFVGENGTGKSTLIEGIAVACGFNAEGGSKNYNFSTYNSHSELCGAIKIIRGIKREKWGYFLRAESFYNVASKTEDYRDIASKEYFYAQYGGKSLHEQSHGESFLALMQKSFAPEGLYILDEPEAALSPQRQLTLLIEIERLARQGAQFIIASHSPILLGLPGAEILSFDEERIHQCRYEETESYQVMELFINNREYLMKRLLIE